MWPFSDPKTDLRAVAEEVVSFVSLTHCDTGFSEFKTQEEAVQRYEEILGMIRDRSFNSAVKLLRTEFAPTGNLQELAMANGWSRRYMVIAKRFDKLERKF